MAVLGRLSAVANLRGIKLAGFYAEFARQRDRFAAAMADVGTCAISGAVGTFASIDPQVEALVARRLELRPEPVSTQVIQRDSVLSRAIAGNNRGRPCCLSLNTSTRAARAACRPRCASSTSRSRPGGGGWQRRNFAAHRRCPGATDYCLNGTTRTGT